jgi:hypothetical protein
MKTVNKDYVKTCGKENKMFLVFNDLIESMTLSQYNERYETNYSNWDDIKDENLFNSEEIIEHYGNEDVKFV